MAWSYEITRAPTSTVTQLSSAFSHTSSQSASVTFSNTISQQTVESSHAYTEDNSGTRVCFGTGGASFTYTAGTNTLTAFETWQIQTGSNSAVTRGVQTYHQTSVYFVGTTTFTIFITFSLETNITQTNSSRYFAGATDDANTAFTSYLSLVRRTWSTVDNTGGTTTATASTEFTSSSSFHNVRPARTYQYIGTTVSDTFDVTNTVTTTSASTYTQVTSTAGPATTTFSATALITTSTTQTTTSSSVGYSTSTINHIALYDLIFHADSTDWAWETTASGKNIIAALGTTVSDTTFSQRAVGVTRPAEPATTAVWTYSINNGANSSIVATLTDSYWFKGTQSSTFSIRTTSSSTYAIGAETTAANAITLSNEQTITRRFTTSTVTTYTYDTTYLYTESNTWQDWRTVFTFLYTYTDSMTSSQAAEPCTFTTTFLAGSYYDSWRVGAVNFSFTQITTISTSGGTTHAQAGSSYTNVDFSGIDEFADSTLDNRAFNMSSQAPGTISFLKNDVAGGFQPWSATGIGSDYATNLTPGAFRLPILSFGHIYPNVIVALMDQESRAFTEGTTTATSVYVSSAHEVRITQQTGTATTETIAVSLVISTVQTIANNLSSINSTASTIGGHGWKRATSDSSLLTCRSGVHSYTSMDSSLGTTRSTTSWGPVHSLAHGNAMNFETLPNLNITPTYNISRHGFVTVLPAFPST